MHKKDVNPKRKENVMKTANKYMKKEQFSSKQIVEYNNKNK